MKHVVSVSGGASSSLMLLRVVGHVGAENVVAIFADTLAEHETTYDLVRAVVARTGVELAWLKDPMGRGLWDVAFDHAFIPNTMRDICSRVLKREPIERWVKERYSPDEAIIHVGFDADEAHRLERTASHWAPYKCVAPLADEEYGPPVYAHEVMPIFRASKLPVPALYDLRPGFAHANCHGFCFKAGIKYFIVLYRTYPDLFTYHEEQEALFNERFREGKPPVSVLRNRKGGTTKPYLMSELRQDVESGAWGSTEQPVQPSLFELQMDPELLEAWEGMANCSCFYPAPGDQG